MKFTELALKPEILAALEEMGYQDMTPIQEQAIPHILEGRDVLGMAETGSGKTSACGVPLAQLADPELNNVQALIIVPTRELALQYVEEVGKVAEQAGVATFAIFGGFDMSIQKAKLRHKVHILVATPGRLIDFLWNTDIIDLRQVRTVVLDEADEMLKMGFIEDVDFIMSCMLQEHQTLLFSATMPAEIERLTKAYLKDPVRIQLNRDQRAPQSLQHHFQHAGGDRFEALIQYLELETIEQAIIFCNSRDKGGTLYRDLRRKFPSIEFIHGGLEQDRRISIFNRFRDKQIRLMVATDVAGRGLDFSHVTHVINYDFPFNLEIYLHRTGRTGRMGRTGIALTLVTDHDLKNFNRLIAGNRIEPVWRGQAPDLGQASTRRARGGRQRQRDGGRGGSGGKRGARRKSPAA
ncbi:MAG: DEAD/DEAH box helicase [Candidatus Latescibacteria bacterium]|nr:DEAD/DEAH box helicase [Candidatus Latescibacterota bacterium]